MSEYPSLLRTCSAAIVTSVIAVSASAQNAPVLSSGGYSAPAEPIIDVVPMPDSGAYFRAEIGAIRSNSDDAFWRSPGPADPTVSFDVDVDNGGMLGLALGYDWRNGFRGEFALVATGERDVSGSCSDVSDGSPCSSHADISSASLSTRGAMLNVYYAPLEAIGRPGRFQPFVTAGIGTVRHEMGEWTRVNPSADRPVRTFEGATTNDFAWTVGAGLSMALDAPRLKGATLETTIRYHDFGVAKGGSTPLPGNGTSSPRDPFQFDVKETVLSVGIRIPL